MKPAYVPSPGFFGNPFVMPPAFPPMAPPPSECGCGCDKTPHYHAAGADCCHPAPECCCGDRRCRKEAKELLVEGRTAAKEVIGKLNPDVAEKAKQTVRFFNLMNGNTATAKTTESLGSTEVNPLAAADVLLSEATLARAGIAEAFIGGGCCVHLSIEYMPETPLAPAKGMVAVLVVDSDKTVMAWGKLTAPTDGYQIQEDIITTHPGAKLTVVAVNLIARVRWCEVFSG